LQESATETKIPQGLKPSSCLAGYGTAEAAPFQSDESKGFVGYGTRKGRLLQSVGADGFADCGTAEAAPLHAQTTESSEFGRLVLHWTWWVMIPVALVSAALATPYLLKHESVPIAFALQRGFALVCHQRPERSFWVFGAPVAVCARCLGIYLGAAVGLLLNMPRRIALRLLVVAAALNLLDAASESLGVHSNWLEARFVLGLLLGAAAAALVASSLPREQRQLS
jgi:uncharacterized membrane protein